MIARQVGGNMRLGRDRGERVERDEAGRLARQRGVGMGAEEGDPLLGIRRGSRVMAEGLAVGDVVAGAAPGIEQPTALAGLEAEDLAGEAEAFRSRGDGPLGVLDQPLTRFVHASINRAVASAEPTTPGIPAPGWVPAPTK